MPDATTLLKFRRLFETHDLCQGPFTAINADLTARGLLLREGTSVAEGAEKEALKAVEKAKASVRAFVEHPFHMVKNLFKYRKVRYRGLANVMIGGRRART